MTVACRQRENRNDLGDDRSGAADVSYVPVWSADRVVVVASAQGRSAWSVRVSRQ